MFLVIRQHLGATFFALKLRIHLVLWHARLQAVASVKLRAGIYIYVGALLAAKMPNKTMLLVTTLTLAKLSILL